MRGSGPPCSRRRTASERPQPGASRLPLALALVLSLALHAAPLWLATSATAPRAPASPAAPPIHWVRVLPAEEAAPAAELPAEEAAPVAEAPPAPEPAPAQRRAAPAARPDPPAASPPAPALAAAPATPAEPGPDVAAARPPRASASLGDLRVLRDRKPRYPRAARLRGAEGVSLLRVRVEPSGRVGQVRVERSAGDTALDRSAREAIRGWRFAALRSPAGAAGLWVLIPVEFRLR